MIAASSSLDFAARYADTPSPVQLPLTRKDLADLFAVFGFTKGAEIGVERGLYSETLCRAIPRLHLTCVDAWTPYPGYREHVSQEKLEGFYFDAKQRLEPYGCTILRDWSQKAARRVEDRSLDFVYIDAAHDYVNVLLDINAWERKVRPGGIVAGHDYGRSSVGQVKEAVEEWTRTSGIAPWFVLMADRSPSWMWVVR